MVSGKYNSKYGKDALMASYEVFIARYDISSEFINKNTTGYKIYKDVLLCI